MAVKGGEIEVMCRCDEVSVQDVDPIKGNNMGGPGKKSENPGKDEGKSKKPPPPEDDDDIEDGDFATPKRDRHGDDDQPL